MILADTSVWIEHLKKGEPRLAAILSEGAVLIHPWISGELACGNLTNRKGILTELRVLPAVKVATDVEALALLEDRKLWGRGLGWIDVHLLVSCLLSGCHLWTLDKRLASAAIDLGVGLSLSSAVR